MHHAREVVAACVLICVDVLLLMSLCVCVRVQERISQLEAEASKAVETSNKAKILERQLALVQVRSSWLAGTCYNYASTYTHAHAYERLSCEHTHILTHMHTHACTRARTLPV